MGDYLLTNETGKQLYQEIAESLPIIDYHCHLSPEEIYLDEPFEDIGDMWLRYDHYKWRLMRLGGIPEEYVTGDKSFEEKFYKFAEVLGFSMGSPLYHWAKMELNNYFGIETPLNAQTAHQIYKEANAYIRNHRLSPRKLMKQSNVEAVGTTDDPLDSLEFHQKLKEDKSFDIRVLPSFRADNLLLILRKDFPGYFAKMGEICSLDEYKRFICGRLDHFVAHGCRMADMGIQYFPDSIGNEKTAERVLFAAAKGEEIDLSDYLAYLGHMCVFLGGEYKKRNMVSQLHIGVRRNPNTEIYEKLGLDRGADCIGQAISVEHVIQLFDAMHRGNGLPRTIVYSLDPALCYPLGTISGSFPGVVLGSAWWFSDNLRKTIDQIKNIAETAHIGSFYGMTTDSRSFLSYARHEYFRKIFCSVVGEWIESGEVVDAQNAKDLVKRVCYQNARNLTI